MPYGKGRLKPLQFYTEIISVPRLIKFFAAWRTDSVVACSVVTGGYCSHSTVDCSHTHLGTAGCIFLTWQRPHCSEALTVNVLQKARWHIEEKPHESLSPHLLSTLFCLGEGLGHLWGISKAWAFPGFPGNSISHPGLSLPHWVTSLCWKPSATAGCSGDANTEKPNLKFRRHLSAISSFYQELKAWFLNYFYFS